jgi:hypothetical protein
MAKNTYFLKMLSIIIQNSQLCIYQNYFFLLNFPTKHFPICEEHNTEHLLKG